MSSSSGIISRNALYWVRRCEAVVRQYVQHTIKASAAVEGLKWSSDRACPAYCYLSAYMRGPEVSVHNFNDTHHIEFW